MKNEIKNNEEEYNTEDLEELNYLVNIKVTSIDDLAYKMCAIC